MIATIHPFEEAGLGRAPFRFVEMTVSVYSAAPGHSQPAGTCDYCGQGIKYCCHIASVDGKTAVVGCDCIRKLERIDNRLISDIDREVAKLEKAARDEKRRAKWQAENERRERMLQAERAANGGFTLAELAAQQRRSEQAAREAEFAAKNAWLIDALDGQSGEFAASMQAKLRQNEVRDLSNRCVSILQDIYAKRHGRRGSKAYQAACDDFDSRVQYRSNP